METRRSARQRSREGQDVLASSRRKSSSPRRAALTRRSMRGSAPRSKRRRRRRCRRTRSSARSRRAPACSTSKSNYETVTVEGFAPHRVPVIVECLTDNNKRTSTNMRHAASATASSRRSRGTSRTSASSRRRRPARRDTEEAAIEAGAQDFEPDGEGGARFYTEPTDLDAVSKALSSRGWTVATMRIGWRARIR